MAYVTGTANTVSDLLAAVQSACTANGWALSAGGVLSKSGCYVEIKVVGSIITIRGGAGVDGSGNLTGATTTATAQFGKTLTTSVGGTQVPFTYPITYEVFINTSPDEVVCVAKYNTNYYQQIAWGKSAMPGLVGSGNWYSGVGPFSTYQLGAPWSEYDYNGYYAGTSLSARNRSGVDLGLGQGIDHALDGPSWSIHSYTEMQALAAYQPNAWNSEAVLMPIRWYAARPSGFISPVLEMAHARLIDISNLEDRQIITLGPDRWKVYPWWTRGARMTSFSRFGDSAQCGEAFRYDGP